MTTASPQLENKVIEILEAIREVLNRLATLEEKTVWHNAVMTQLTQGQKEMADRISSLVEDRGRIALLEREVQYLTGDMQKQSRQVDTLSALVNELSVSGKANSKTVTFMEKVGSTLITAALAAMAGALAVRTFLPAVIPH